MQVNYLISAVEIAPEEFNTNDRVDLESLIQNLEGATKQEEIENAVADWLISHQHIDEYINQNKKRLSTKFQSPINPADYRFTLLNAMKQSFAPPPQPQK